MKTLIIGLLVVGLCIGCAGSNSYKLPTPEEYTLMALVEKSRTCEPDKDGWGVLGIPDKDFDNDFIEFVFFTKGDNWGVGIVQHGENGGSATLVYNGDTQKWFAVQYGTPMECTLEDAKILLEEFWTLVQDNGDFTKMRTFKILTPIPKGNV